MRGNATTILYIYGHEDTPYSFLHQLLKKVKLILTTWVCTLNLPSTLMRWT